MEWRLFERLHSSTTTSLGFNLEWSTSKPEAGFRRHRGDHLAYWRHRFDGPSMSKSLSLPPLSTGFTSLIVPDFPGFFAEFRGKRCAMLWRGSSDGFRACDFHGRCDGDAKTLTFIQDTAGTIFGASRRRSGSGSRRSKSEEFSFNTEESAQEKDKAIFCAPSCGRDIRVSDDGNASTDSSTCDFGYDEANDTGRDWEILFTGS
jgi:hypothetical protein